MLPTKNGGPEAEVKFLKSSYFKNGPKGNFELSIPETPRTGRLMEKTEEHEKVSCTIDHPFISSENSSLEDKDLASSPIINKRIKVAHDHNKGIESDSPVPLLPALTQSTSIPVSPIEPSYAAKANNTPSPYDLAARYGSINVPVTCFADSDEAPKLAFQTELTYFNLANPHELMNLTSLTPSEAELVQELRPFDDEADIQKRLFSKSKGKSISKKFHALVQSFEAVDELITECKEYFSKLEISSSHYISSKPRFLSDDITLKSYQVTGANWLLSMFHNKCGVILADEMGLGKTCQVITMIGKLVDEGVKGPHLVVVPSSVVDNWLNEFERFCPHISVLPYRAPPRMQKSTRCCFPKWLIDTKDKHLLSENSVELSKARIEKVKAIMVPFILRRCKEQVLKDLPLKIEFIQRCPLNKTQRARYSTEIASARLESSQGVSQLLSLSSKLRRIANHTMLIPRGHHFTEADRRKIADRIVHDPTFYMSDKDVIYEELLEYADGDTQELCLKYKCVNKFALQDQQWMESGKVDWLRKELPAMVKRGDRVLIFSQFTMMLDILEKVLETLSLTFFRIDGQTPVEERQGLIDEFNSNTAIKVFLLSTRSGGCGINLTGANVVILHDLDHNPQNDRQAEARAHRVGQIRDVSVFKLVSENTIEERILAIGNAKLELHSRLSGDVRQLGDQRAYPVIADSTDGEGDMLQALRDEIMRPLDH
ncbi:DNA-dependent ATPase fun30 [Massospora cicadina]|nr:DNA-dependent ATPase fun30 [Massospora cicadina]